MIAELSLLVSLQETDIEIKRCNAEAASLPTRKSSIERKFEASAKEFLSLKSEFETAAAEKNRLETDIASETAKHEKFKADLMKATNEREYTTAVREVDSTKKVISTLETELLKIMEKVEKLEVQVNERSPEIEIKRKEVDDHLSALAAAVDADQKNLATLGAERDRLAALLTPATRSTYERVARMKSGLVLSEAKNYACSACRMTMRPQAFSEIKRGDKIHECENCGRILYYKSEISVAG